MSKVWTPRPQDQVPLIEFGASRDKWLLLAPPGAGKTAIAASWAANLMYEELCLPRLLIVAPPMVARDAWPAVGQWQHLERFASDMRVLTAEDFDLRPRAMVIGDEDAWECMLGCLDEPTKAFCEVNRLGLDFWDMPRTRRRLLGYTERIHVCPKPFFPWLERCLGLRMPYQGVIYDESSGLRDPSSDQTKSMRRFVHSTVKKTKVDYVCLLTGTPNANHGPAIYPQAHLVAPGLLAKNLTDFRTRWCQPDTVNRQTGDVYSWKIVPALQDELARKIASVGVSVPSTLSTPLVELEIAVATPPDALAAYRRMEDQSVWASASAANPGVRHSKLRQMAAGFVYDDNDKVLFLDNSRIERIVEDATEYGGQIVLAFNFQEEADRLRKAFGDRVKDIRQTGAKEAFTSGRLPYLMLHPASAGHGVDGLQHACNQLWWVSLTDDLELYQQTNARVHRHGTQAQTVYVRRYFAPGTIEEQIKDVVLPGKASLADLILRGTRVGSTVQV